MSALPPISDFLETENWRSGPGDWQPRYVRSTAGVGRSIGAVVDAMDAAGYPQLDLFAMRLALQEALVNALRHGNRNDPDKWVRVRFRVTPEETLAQVKDEGEGFDPGLVPDPLSPENLGRPSGRGLFLMCLYLTWLRHSQNGTCVTLCRCRSFPPRSPL